jgi:gliding motility-associated-like protein
MFMDYTARKSQWNAINIAQITEKLQFYGPSLYIIICQHFVNRIMLLKGQVRLLDRKMSGLILPLLFPAAMAFAQVTSPTADYIDSVSYPVHAGKDPLFVFYQINQGPKSGSLSATLPGSASYNFEWSRYNETISGFDPPFASETNVTASSVADLQEGGYRVRIYDGGTTDTSLIAWVMQDHMTASVLKDANNEILPAFSTCNFMVVIGNVEPDTFIYYDPTSHAARELPIGFKYKWTSDNPDLTIPNDSTNLRFNITYLPPVEDTWYILTVTDELGMVEVDSVFYVSKVTHAKFTVEYLDKVTGEYDPDLGSSWTKDVGSTDARLTVRFINESENGMSYEWVFLDTLGGIKQSYETPNVDEQPEFTYETADKYYYPYLISTSEFDCIDSFALEEPIYVARALLEIPNVFTPNGDPFNDRWVFKHQSIKTCRITVVDRTGKVVYKRMIDDIYTWEGWDGNVLESNRRAPEGQYYFVVEALGYDGQEFRDPNIIERWKSNRGNKNNQGTGGTGTEEPLPDNLYTGWLYLYRYTGTF